MSASNPLTGTEGFEVTVLKEGEMMQLGTYVPLIMDASLEFAGLTWWHVAKGFDRKGTRNDWIADVKGYAVSVTEHHRKVGMFGWDGDMTMAESMADQIARSFDAIQHRIAEHVLELGRETQGLMALKGAVANLATTPTTSL